MTKTIFVPAAEYRNCKVFNPTSPPPPPPPIFLELINSDSQTDCLPNILLKRGPQTREDTGVVRVHSRIMAQSSHLLLEIKFAIAIILLAKLPF